MPSWPRAFALAAALFCAAQAQAETRRFALAVGSNHGATGRKVLRYAESDAAKFSRVLTTLGGVAPDDLLLLQGANREEVGRALDLLTRRIGEVHRTAGSRAVLLFYFSGHADGTALELGDEKLPYAEVRQRLAASGADVRLAIVDACQSGGLLAAKGGRAGTPFAVTLDDSAAPQGAVFLTSSAASEYALESSEVQGSFFTHHLVSGLRGAADVSGDGKVTLDEAYRYAFERTVAATSDTTVGPQHPSYDVALTGQGELVLTDLRDRPVAALELPAGFTRALVMDLAAEQVVAELGPAGAPRVGLAPGRYLVRLWRGTEIVGETLELRAGEARRVLWTELAPQAHPLVSAKGQDVEVAVATAAPAEVHEPAAALGLLVGGGVGASVAGTPSALPALRIALENMHASGLSVALQASRGQNSDGRETALELRLGLRLGTDVGRARLFLGFEAGPGMFFSRKPEKDRNGALLEAGPRLGLRIALARRFFLTAEVEAMGALAISSGKVDAVGLPAALLGLELGIF